MSAIVLPFRRTEEETSPTLVRLAQMRTAFNSVAAAALGSADLAEVEFAVDVSQKFCDAIADRARDPEASGRAVAALLERLRAIVEIVAALEQRARELRPSCPVIRLPVPKRRRTRRAVTK